MSNRDIEALQQSLNSTEGALQQSLNSTTDAYSYEVRGIFLKEYDKESLFTDAVRLVGAENCFSYYL